MKTRKKLPKTALPRIYFIDQQIASGTYPNARTIARDYETSPSTIARDIEFMRSVLNAPIIFNHDHNGYYYAEKTYRLPAGFATAEEMLALGMVKSLLSLYRDTPLYHTTQQLLELITAPLRSYQTDPQEPPWYETRVVAPPLASAPVLKEIWEPITTALRENRVLHFDYLGTWDEEYQPRQVRPYQLLFDQGLWYLYGYAEERKSVRMFSLVRIKNMVLTKKTFTLPPDYDYSAKIDGSYFGVFIGAKKYRFRVFFNEDSIVWVQDRKWAADQVIEQSSPGVVVDFTSTQYEQVLGWVLSRGSTAQPLAPPQLVKDWREQIEIMQQNAAKSPSLLKT